MKLLKQTSLLLFAAGLCATSALASGGHHYHGNRTQFGVYIGGPVYPWYYPPPVYYPPPAFYPPRVIVVQPSPPPVYIEQAPAPASSQYWYFCQQANAYYPQVPDCPAGWIRVPPRQ
jgi:hypothetical protein